MPSFTEVKQDASICDITPIHIDINGDIEFSLTLEHAMDLMQQLDAAIDEHQKTLTYDEHGLRK